MNKYTITVFYDNEKYGTYTYPDALSAVEAYARCNDWGFAKEYATYNLSEPDGKMHTKTFYRSGKVTTK
jgi:hypothetical protein